MDYFQRLLYYNRCLMKNFYITLGMTLESSLMRNFWRHMPLTDAVCESERKSSLTRVKCILTEILQAQCVKETTELCMVLDDRGKFFESKNLPVSPPLPHTLCSVLMIPPLAFNFLKVPPSYSVSDNCPPPSYPWKPCDPLQKSSTPSLPQAMNNWNSYLRILFFGYSKLFCR